MNSCTIVESLLEHSQNQPDNDSFIFLPNGEEEGEKLTFGELDLRVRALAAELQNRYSKGDRAILIFTPGLEFVVGYMACLFSGILPVPVFPPHKTRLQQQIPVVLNIIRDSSPKFILTESEYRVSTLEKYEELPELKGLTWECSDFVSPYSANNWKFPKMDGNTPAFIQYTSGSTGNPQGVVVTHDNLIHNLSCIQQYFNATTETRVVSWLPPYHDMGLIGCILQPIYVGFLSVLMPPVSFLQRPYRWLKTISDYHITAGGGPNFAYELCLKRISPEQRSELDLSSWDMAFNGSEVIYLETLRNFCKYFEPSGFRPQSFFPCFGLAESTLIVTGIGKPDLASDYNLSENITGYLNDNQVSTKQARVNCGYPILGTEVKIVDPETRKECPEKEIGEIWVKGRSVAQSYFNKKEESERTFRATLADSGYGPFLRTGDLGFLFKGQLYVTGRIKNLIICNGSNHYATDIENTVLQCHQAIGEHSCAAFSIEVGTTEQLIIMAELDARYLRNHPGTTFEEVEQAITNSISLNHQIKVYNIVLLENKRIPKTTSGKIKRDAAKEEYIQYYSDGLKV
jgi:acyl-CoA synthetase (AMP-forming)/AMP-acid ligase II